MKPTIRRFLSIMLAVGLILGNTAAVLADDNDDDHKESKANYGKYSKYFQLESTLATDDSSDDDSDMEEKGKGKDKLKLKDKDEEELETEDDYVAASVYEDEGDYSKAVEALKKAMLKIPQAPGLPKALGRVLLKQDDLDDAMEELMDSLEMDYEDDETYKHLGEAFKKKGDDDIKVFVKGKQPKFDVVPEIVYNRTVVPFRAISESLGATVNWDQATNTVTIQNQTTTVILTIGSTEALVNGQPVTLDVPAFVKHGRTLVPIRFVSEALSANVNWDPTYKMVIIK